MDQGTQDLVERMGLFLEREGHPRIAGRVLGYLLVSGEPRSLDDLADALRVSKSSASTDARLLERLGIAERVTMPGDRRDYYRVSGELAPRLVALWGERLRVARDLLEAALETPAAEDRQVERRLQRDVRLMRRLEAAVEEAWRGPRSAGEGGSEERGYEGVA